MASRGHFGSGNRRHDLWIFRSRSRLYDRRLFRDDRVEPVIYSKTLPHSACGINRNDLETTKHGITLCLQEPDPAGNHVAGYVSSKNFYLSLFLLFMSGVFDNVSVIIRATTLQLLTPDEMRGRVASVNSIFIGSSNEIGSFESGLAAKIMGLIPSVIFGGSMTLLVVAAIAKKAPLLRRLNLRALK